MKMTDEQFNALAQFEDNYKTAIDLGYSRYPGRAGVDTMFNIYRDLTDARVNMNRSCPAPRPEGGEAVLRGEGPQGGRGTQGKGRGRGKDRNQA